MTIQREMFDQFPELKKIVDEVISEAYTKEKDKLELKGSIPEDSKIAKKGSWFIGAKQREVKAKNRKDSLGKEIIGYLLRVRRDVLETLRWPIKMQRRQIFDINQEQLELALGQEMWRKLSYEYKVREIDFAKLEKVLKEGKVSRESVKEAIEVSYAFPLVPQIPKWAKK